MTAEPSSAPFNRKLRWGIASVRQQIEVGLEKGLSLDACLDGSGISAAMLEDPAAEIEIAQELQVVANMLTALGDRARGLGLETGQRTRLTRFGIWGYALLCSPTLGDALDLGLRYIDLSYSPCRVAQERGERETSVLLDASHLPPELRIYAIERTAASIISLQRELLGMPMPLYRLWLEHPPQVPEEMYRMALGVMPDFNRPYTVGTFDSRLLDIRMPRSNTLSWKMCEAQCRQLLQQRKFREGLSGQVRDLLLRDPASTPDFDSVARQLGMVPLKMRRTLAAEGSNFRALVDEIKGMLAEQMLLIEGVTVQQASNHLGYENSTSFSKSFRRWTGMVPSEYIQQRRRRPATDAADDTVVARAAHGGA